MVLCNFVNLRKGEMESNYSIQVQHRVIKQSSTKSSCHYIESKCSLFAVDGLAGGGGGGDDDV